MVLVRKVENASDGPEHPCMRSNIVINYNVLSNVFFYCITIILIIHLAELTVFCCSFAVVPGALLLYWPHSQSTHTTYTAVDPNNDDQNLLVQPHSESMSTMSSAYNKRDE